MGCDTMPTKSSLDHGMQDREALQLVLENLSMIGLNSNLFDKDARPTLNDESDQMHVERKRVSANITENIPVPSSEHVAEIVGKQGW